MAPHQLAVLRSPCPRRKVQADDHTAVLHVWSQRRAVEARAVRGHQRSAHEVDLALYVLGKVPSSAS